MSQQTAKRTAARESKPVWNAKPPKKKGAPKVHTAPSPYWIDQLRSGRQKHWPPKANHAPMVPCASDNRTCNGRYSPDYYVGDVNFAGMNLAGVCDDCRAALWFEYEQRLREECCLPGQRSDQTRGQRHEDVNAEVNRILFERAAGGGFQVGEIKLPTEDEAILQQQIDRYLAGQETTLIPSPFSA